MRNRVAVGLCALALGLALRETAAQKADPRPDVDLANLPLRVVTSKTSPPIALAIMLTGDGGWAGLDRRIADVLAAHGVGVVGLDSRAYLMHERTPEGASADIARVIRRYSPQWSSRVAVIGYSRGADLAPFIVNRLPADLRSAVSLVALLGPAERADFEFHWTDLLSETSRPSDRPILPELERLRGMTVLCVYGQDEKESLCRLADPAAVHVDRRSGRHHFDGNYDAIASEIMRLIAPVDTTSR